MASVMLLYVGAVLFCNGLWLLGHIEDKEIKVIDTFVGGLGLVVVLLLLMQGTLLSLCFEVARRNRRVKICHWLPTCTAV